MRVFVTFLIFCSLLEKFYHIEICYRIRRHCRLRRPVTPSVLKISHVCTRCFLFCSTSPITCFFFPSQVRTPCIEYCFVFSSCYFRYFRILHLVEVEKTLIIFFFFFCKSFVLVFFFLPFILLSFMYNLPLLVRFFSSLECDTCRYFVFLYSFRLVCSVF